MLGERTITLLRAVSGPTISETTGEPSAVARTSTAIRATYQPGIGKNRRFDAGKTSIDPQGHRVREQRRIYTITELRSVDQWGFELADRLVFASATWVVLNVDNHDAIGMSLKHFEATVSRLDESDA